VVGYLVVILALQARGQIVVCYAIGQLAAGTRRVQQRERTRSRADTGDTR
jgi:hypothetical protein